jgi:hypothetical protein
MLVYRLFENPGTVSQTYCVWLYWRGRFRPVAVDDVVEFVEEGGKLVPVGLHHAGGEVWVMVLRKAVVQLLEEQRMGDVTLVMVLEMITGGRGVQFQLASEKTRERLHRLENEHFADHSFLLLGEKEPLLQVRRIY